MPEEKKEKMVFNGETAQTYLKVIQGLRDETAAWAAFRSKRFTVSFAVILVVMIVGMFLLSKSVLLSIPFFAIAGFVATSYGKWQAQVDIAQAKSIAVVGTGGVEALQKLED